MFLAGWPSTEMYVCVNGFPQAIGISTTYPGANTIGVGNSSNTAWRTPSYADILALWSGTKDAEHCTAGDGTMQPCSGGGITANPLIFATSGGAAPSGTFNGSAAVTIDYHSLGAQQVLGYTPTNAAVMPSTAPGAGYIPIGNAGGTAYAPLSLSGDCSLASTGAITCTKSNGTAFASGAFAAAYSLPGTVVQTNQANTFGAYLQDFSAATQMKLPVASGYTSAANGEIGYDSSGNNWHGWVNGADMFAAFLPKTGMTNNHCVEFAVSGSTITLADAGGTCTTGGSMVWPATPGIVYWTSGTTWGGAYNSSTPIPATYLPTTLSSSSSMGTSCTVNASSTVTGVCGANTNTLNDGSGNGAITGKWAVSNFKNTNITAYALAMADSTNTEQPLIPSSWTSGHTFVPAWKPSGSALAPVTIDMTYAAALNYTPASWPTVAGIPYWTSGTSWGGAYNSSTPIPANYLPLALSSSTSVNGTSIPASATLCIVSSLCSGYQAALTNPVTGPGSGVTIGHMAVMGNTSGTSITDGGAIPSVGTWGALNYPSWSSGTPFVKMTAAGTFSLDTNTYASSSASTTVNGQTCTLGSTCTIPFQTNSSGNTSQAGINLLTSTANSVGLTVTPTNSATNAETFEVTGTYSGGISSSQVTTGLGYTPANCTSGTATSDCITNAMTTLGDLLYGGASGASTRLPGPTGAAATTYVFTNTTNGSSQAQIPAWANAPHISAANMTSFPTIISLSTAGSPGPATQSGNALTIPTGVKWFGTGNANVGGSLSSSSTGSYNTAVGQSSLAANSSGNYNTALGYLSLNGNTIGVTNTGIGYESLQSMATGQEDTAVGAFALTFDTGAGYNTAVGEGAMYRSINGEFNVAIGDSAFTNQTSGLGNTAVGYNSLDGVYGSGSGGNYNVAVGDGALGDNTTGSNNTAVGTTAGVGSPALQTGTNNTYLGDSATANADGYTNSTALGYGATITASNQIMLGNTSVTTVTTSASVGIGTTAPGSLLTVKGGDAFVDGSARGLILRDTVVTTNCYRITIASGVITPTLVTCPTD